MAPNSSTVQPNDNVLASQYNNLRLDVLCEDTGHAHTGAEDGGNKVSHANLVAASVTADLHHTGFIGLQDETPTNIAPAADDYIKVFSANNILTTTAVGNTLKLTILEGNIDHGNLDSDSLDHDDHGAVYPNFNNPETETITAAWTFDANIIMGDGVAIGQAAGPLITFDDTLDYLEVMGCDTGFGTATPGAKVHVLDTAEQLRLGYDAGGYMSVTVADGGSVTLATTTDNTTGNMTLAPAGYVLMNPTGNFVNPVTTYDINLGTLRKKYLSLHVAELWVETLVAQETLATIGGRILVGPTTYLTRDIGTGDTTIYVKHNEMTVGDTVYLEAHGWVEFILVGLGSNLLDNPGFETAGGGGADIWADWTEDASDGALANTQVAEEKHGGDDAAKITAGASINTQVYQDITVVAGTKYRLTFWSRGDGTHAGRYSLRDNNSLAFLYYLTSTGNATATYAEVSLDFIAPPGCTSVRLWFHCPATDTGVAYFDDGSITTIYVESTNLIDNPGFETAGGGDPDFWADWTEDAGDGTLANETNNQHSGNDAAKITAGGSHDTQIEQDIAVIPGKQYQLKFWSRGDGSHDGRFSLRDNNASVFLYYLKSTGNASATYGLVTRHFTAPPDCTSVRLWFHCPWTDTGVAYFDNASLNLTEYSYTVTRDRDGTGPNAWNAGDALFNTGTTGDGFMDLYSVHGIKATSEIGPTIVGNIRNSATYNDWTEHWAIGNLNGIYGYSSTAYGVAFGAYSESPYITIESTNGIQFKDAADAVQAQLTGTTWTLGLTASEHILITATTIQIKDGAAVVYTELTAGVLTLGLSTAEHAIIDASGVTLKDGATTYAVFAATTTIGATATEHISITSSTLEVKDGGTVYAVFGATTTIGAIATEHISITSSTIQIKDGITVLTEISGGSATFGEVAANQGNMYWNTATKTLQFRGGANGTVTAVSISTDGSMDILGQETEGAITLGGIPQLNSITWVDSGAGILFRIGVSKKTTAVTDVQAHLYVRTAAGTNSSLRLGLYGAVLYGPKILFKNTGGTEAVEIWGSTDGNSGTITLLDDTIISAGLNVGTTGAGAGEIFTSGAVVVGGTSADELLHVGANAGAVDKYIKVQTAGTQKAGIKFVGGAAGIWHLTHDDSTALLEIGLDANEFISIDASGNSYPGGNKTQDLGLSGTAWDDVWGDDWQDEPDYYYMDERKNRNGEIVPVDDLAIICGIRPSGQWDTRTGLPLIDDATLPEWLFTRDKHTGETIYNLEGKPYMSMKMRFGLSWGAIRQLDGYRLDADAEREAIRVRLTNLESARLDKYTNL